jgi:hypothetical protein
MPSDTIEPVQAEAGERRSPTLRADQWLALAATPTFALMALATAVGGDAASTLICSAAHSAPILTGMVTMYLLMSLFHSPPWVRLIGDRWRGGATTTR